MKLETNEIHIWSVNLTPTPEQESEKLILLSPDEQIRANQFRSPVHRQRFIIARSALREILSYYIDKPAPAISFAYTKHRKPYLNNTNLQFNLSHSHDKAIFALSQNHFLGVDIEKIQTTFTQDVANRYFTQQENNDLNELCSQDRNTAFYRIWTRKEALVKAAGKGLAIPLSSFSVSIKDIVETVSLMGELWFLTSLSAPPDYQAAFASNQIIKKLSYWRFFDQLPQLYATEFLT